jgi:hypothetical protein
MSEYEICNQISAIKLRLAPSSYVTCSFLVQSSEENDGGASLLSEVTLPMLP